ncbi:MAG: hypothetical protein ABIO70_36850 [Pseudomonadota bacterium]
MNLLRRIWRRLKAIGRRVQAAAVVAGLWWIYWLGLGATRLLVRLVRPALLADPAPEGSFWQPVPADDDASSQLHHQS